MKAKEFYEYAYKLMENVTPLTVDCGKLCDAACCKGDEETGMYLFPFESIMFNPMPDYFKVEQSDFEYGDDKFADIAICKPFCTRSQRPLACRIFPLIPYIKGGKMEVIMDPRGRALCPLAKVMKIEELDDIFVKKVRYLSKIMIKNKELYGFLEHLSRLTDDSFYGFY